MTELRQALDAYIAGQIDLAALKRVLSASLTKSRISRPRPAPTSRPCIGETASRARRISRSPK